MVAGTTESIFHQNIIIMLTPGDKWLFEKYRNAILVILMQTGDKYRSKKKTFSKILPAILANSRFAM